MAKKRQELIIKIFAILFIIAMVVGSFASALLIL